MGLISDCPSKSAFESNLDLDGDKKWEIEMN